MDIKRFNAIMDNLKADALERVKRLTPVRTGNLQNSVRARDLPNGGFEIYIDTVQAPYAKYTIEPWTDGRFNGKPNPNEGWSEDAAKIFIRETKAKLNASTIKISKGTGE